MTQERKKLTTRIGTAPPDISRLRFRGKDTLGELVGTATFTECIYLAATGKMPNPRQAGVLDACLVILMDHGITPSSLVARLVADTVPTDIQVPIAAGLLTVGNKFMGTIAGAGEIFSAGVASKADPAQWAAERVAQDLRAKRRFPGFGHPDYFPDDPRTLRLWQVAEKYDSIGPYVTIARHVEQEIERQSRRLPMNATGAIGALLCEIGFPVAGMRGVAVISRSAGLLAHSLEELETRTASGIMSLVQDAVPYEE
jgi:citrate synthase